MEQNITINANSLKSQTIGAQAPLGQEKQFDLNITGAEEARDDGTRETILNISKEAKIRLSHQADNASHEKTTEITSAKEYFEMNPKGDCDNPVEIFRLLAPEVYEECRGFYEKSVEEYRRVRPEVDQKWSEYTQREVEYFKEYFKSGVESFEGVVDPLTETERKEFEHVSSLLFNHGVRHFYSDKEREYFEQAEKIFHDWDNTHMYSKEYQLLQRGGLIGRTKDTLRSIYSDAEHNVNFEYYASDSDKKARLWLLQSGSKFNVLLSSGIFKSLTLIQKTEGKDKANHLMSRIDKAVNEMKSVERNYQGDIEDIRFGVKFHEDDTVTYHAWYKGCGDNRDGIQADSAEELLEKLRARG